MISVVDGKNRLFTSGNDQFIDLLKRSGLAERRPVDRRETVRAMVQNADLMVTIGFSHHPQAWILRPDDSV